jgi:hypothetical protein
MSRKNTYLTLYTNNIISKITPLLTSEGWVVRKEDKKIAQQSTSIAWNSPWVFFNQDIHPGMRCDVFLSVLYPYFSVISSRCRECYKVMVKPRTIVELFELHDMMKEMGVHCKCGVDKRPYTDARYLGAFYNKGKEEGLERYAQVRKMIPKEVPVGLKRYCTEFEVRPTGIGPSDQLPEMTHIEKFREDQVLDRFVEQYLKGEQGEEVRNSIKEEWIKYAFRTGDLTYKELTNGKSIYGDCVTYHGE